MNDADTSLPWEQRHAPSLTTSSLLAVIGGFLDGFTYVGHGHVFANAMTGNVVLLGIYGIAQSWQESLHHLPPIITFILGIGAARAMLLKKSRAYFRYPYVSVLVTELLVISFISLLPARTPDFWITTSVAFVASMQIETFRVVNGRSFNSTFTTGNLRSLSEGLFDWLFQHNVHDAKSKAADFGLICLCFLIGASAGGSLTGYLGNRALLADVVLLFVLVLRLWPRRVLMDDSAGAHSPAEQDYGS